MEGAEAWLPLVLTAVLDGGERSTSRPFHFTIGKERRYPFSKRLVGPRACVDDLEKRRIVSPIGIRSPDRVFRSLVAVGVPSKLFGPRQ